MTDYTDSTRMVEGEFILTVHRSKQVIAILQAITMYRTATFQDLCTARTNLSQLRTPVSDQAENKQLDGEHQGNFTEPEM